MAEDLRLALRQEAPADRVRAITSIQTALDRLTAAKEWYRNVKRRDPKDPDRQRVERTLSELGPLPGLVHDLLLKACSDPDAGVRLAAVEAANPDRFNTFAGLPVFRRMLADPDIRVQTRAIYRLGQLREDAREAVPEIIRLLRESNDNGIQVNAVGALGRMRSAAKEATPVLAECLVPTNPINVRYTAIVALASIGESHRPAAQVLIDALRDRPDGITRNLAGVLYLCEENAIPATEDLKVLFRCPPDNIKPQDRIGFRQSVLAPFQAIGRHDDGETFDFLLGVADDSKEDLEVRQEALSMLGRCGPKATRALPAVIDLHRKALDPVTRADYGRLDLAPAVVPLGAAAVPDLINLVNQGPDKLRLWAVQMLQAIGPPASLPAAPHVEPWRRKGDPKVQFEIRNRYSRIAGEP